jgi:hypothetical protein
MNPTIHAAGRQIPSLDPLAARKINNPLVHDRGGRFTRLTNAFSKKVENHEVAVALHFMFYNFARIHQTLRITPAMRIPMKADTCSNPYRTPFQSCRTVVGAKRRSESLIKGCPTAVKSSPPISGSFGAPSRGDAWTVHPSASSRRLFGRAVSGGNKRPNSSSGCRRSLRVTDSPARPNRRAWD